MVVDSILVEVIDIVTTDRVVRITADIEVGTIVNSLVGVVGNSFGTLEVTIVVVIDLEEVTRILLLISKDRSFQYL